MYFYYYILPIYTYFTTNIDDYNKKKNTVLIYILTA